MNNDWRIRPSCLLLLLLLLLLAETRTRGDSLLLLLLLHDLSGHCVADLAADLLLLGDDRRRHRLVHHHLGAGLGVLEQLRLEPVDQLLDADLRQELPIPVLLVTLLLLLLFLLSLLPPLLVVGVVLKLRTEKE